MKRPDSELELLKVVHKCRQELFAYSPSYIHLKLRDWVIDQPFLNF